MNTEHWSINSVTSLTKVQRKINRNFKSTRMFAKTATRLRPDLKTEKNFVLFYMRASAESAKLSP